MRPGTSLDEANFTEVKPVGPGTSLDEANFTEVNFTVGAPMVQVGRSSFDQVLGLQNNLRTLMMKCDMSDISFICSKADVGKPYCVTKDG